MTAVPGAAATTPSHHGQYAATRTVTATRVNVQAPRTTSRSLLTSSSHDIA
ncbi:hypothetical protein [Streptomyces sp.]|uniref:hypothetical protein n=1 Tax=Streptomyces sp. TaxID=1931 RepID=UPI002F3EBD52